MLNKEIRLASRPAGMPTPDNFSIVDEDMPPLNDGEVLVRSLYISVDPYLRGRMREGRSYVAPFEVGQVIVSGVVGEVVESRAPEFAQGDIVTGMLGWRLYNAASVPELRKVIRGLLRLLPHLASWVCRGSRLTSDCWTSVSRKQERQWSFLAQPARWE